MLPGDFTVSERHGHPLVSMKTTNLYNNWKLMTIATNLYYCCGSWRWQQTITTILDLEGVELQGTPFFQLLLMLLFVFVCFLLFRLLFFSSTAPHTTQDTHKDKRKKNQNQNKKKKTTKISNKNTNFLYKKRKSKIKSQKKKIKRRNKNRKKKTEEVTKKEEKITNLLLPYTKLTVWKAPSLRPYPTQNFNLGKAPKLMHYPPQNLF